MPTLPPLKYFVPNGFTAFSLLIGLASVVCSAQGDFELAAWMILWGALLDKVDGTAARMLDATSKFGVEFDSFADFISFGVAPAALFYFKLAGSGGATSRYVAMAAAGLYALALAVRLARFNVMTGGESVFYGAPGTMMGGVLASGYLAFSKYGLAAPIMPYMPAVLFVSAFLMISTLRLPKLKMRKNKGMNAFIGVSVLAAYVLAPLRLLPELLFGLAAFYMVGGFIAGAMMEAESEHAATTLTPPDDAGAESTPAAPQGEHEAA